MSTKKTSQLNQKKEIEDLKKDFLAFLIKDTCPIKPLKEKYKKKISFNAYQGLKTKKASKLPFFISYQKAFTEPNKFLDVHGLTEEKAYQKIKKFIFESQRNNLGRVLIITGKGNPLHKTGILKQNAPRWLSTPLFKDVIKEVKQASPQDGGEGAFDVYLYRSFRPKSFGSKE